MTIKNEALRLFLAGTALILTAMLAGPINEPSLLGSNSSDQLSTKKVMISKLSNKSSKKSKGLLITSRH